MGAVCLPWVAGRVSVAKVNAWDLGSDLAPGRASDGTRATAYAVEGGGRHPGPVPGPPRTTDADLPTGDASGSTRPTWENRRRLPSRCFLSHGRNFRRRWTKLGAPVEEAPPEVLTSSPTRNLPRCRSFAVGRHGSRSEAGCGPRPFRIRAKGGRKR